MKQPDIASTKKLDVRQIKLYALIKENSLMGKKTTQQEICDKLGEYGYEYVERSGTTDKCSQIWNDIRDINMSDERDKIIITDKYVYWIGSEEETTEYLNRCWDALVPSLDRYWKMIKKAKRNGQYKIFSTRGDIIDDNSKARRYVESFIDKTLDEMNDEELLQQDRDVLKKYCESLGGYVYIKGMTKEDFIKEIRECQRYKK